MLRANGELGAEQIATLAQMDKWAVCRRLPELQVARLVAPTGKTRKTVSGRSERIWEAL